MPTTTPVQRMMFLQGQFYFFCNRNIPKDEASLEHLVPASTGGSAHPDNLVACCKTLNAIFGNMSVKEKIRAILKQNGQVRLPESASPAAGESGHRAAPADQDTRVARTEQRCQGQRPR